MADQKLLLFYVLLGVFIAMIFTLSIPFLVGITKKRLRLRRILRLENTLDVAKRTELILKMLKREARKPSLPETLNAIGNILSKLPFESLQSLLHNSQDDHHTEYLIYDAVKRLEPEQSANILLDLLVTPENWRKSGGSLKVLAKSGGPAERLLWDRLRSMRNNVCDKDNPVECGKQSPTFSPEFVIVKTLIDIGNSPEHPELQISHKWEGCRCIRCWDERDSNHNYHHHYSGFGIQYEPYPGFDKFVYHRCSYCKKLEKHYGDSCICGYREDYYRKTD